MTLRELFARFWPALRPPRRWTVLGRALLAPVVEVDEAARGAATRGEPAVIRPCTCHPDFHELGVHAPLAPVPES